MRISMDVNDPGYQNAKLMAKRNYKIHLDGELVKNCVTADDVAGFVMVLLTRPNGQYIVDPVRNAPTRMCYYGKVEIIQEGL